jgi:hypothetical protein
MFVWMIFELAVNLKATGGYCGHDRSWNLFDTAILAGSVFQLSFSTLNMSFVRIVRLGRLMKFIRLMRLIKIFKVLHLLRFLHGVRRMILCMVGSLTSLFWAMTLIFFVLFCMSLFFMQGIEFHYDSKLDSITNFGVCVAGGDVSSIWDGKLAPSEILPMLTVDPIQDTQDQQIMKLYGSIPSTMITLFGTISGGAEWAVVADPVSRISSIFTFVWILFICTTMIGVLNVFTGIFVDAAMRSASEDHTTIVQAEQDEYENAVKTLREAFKSIDVDGSGTITEEEFLDLLEVQQDVSSMLHHLGLETAEATGLFRLLDDDRSGVLNIDEFISGCLALKGMAKRIDAVTLMSQNKRLAKTVLNLMEMTEEMWNDIEMSKDMHHKSLPPHLRDQMASTVQRTTPRPSFVPEAPKVSPRESGAGSAPRNPASAANFWEDAAPRQQSKSPALTPRTNGSGDGALHI